MYNVFCLFNLYRAPDTFLVILHINFLKPLKLLEADLSIYLSIYFFMSNGMWDLRTLTRD